MKERTSENLSHAILTYTVYNFQIYLNIVDYLLSFTFSDSILLWITTAIICSSLMHVMYYAMHCK